MLKKWNSLYFLSHTESNNSKYRDRERFWIYWWNQVSYVWNDIKIGSNWRYFIETRRCVRSISVNIYDDFFAPFFINVMIFPTNYLNFLMQITNKYPFTINNWLRKRDLYIIRWWPPFLKLQCCWTTISFDMYNLKTSFLNLPHVMFCLVYVCMCETKLDYDMLMAFLWLRSC